MRSKLHISIVIFLGFLLFAATFGTGFATAMVVTGGHSAAALQASGFDLFWEAWDLVRQDFYGDLPDDTQLVYGAIHGSLGDAG